MAPPRPRLTITTLILPPAPGSLAQRKLTRAFHWSVAGNGTERSIMMVLAVILGTG